MVPRALRTPEPGSAPHFPDGQSRTWHGGREVLSGLLPGPPDVASTRASSGARGRQPVSVGTPRAGSQPSPRSPVRRGPRARGSHHSCPVSSRAIWAGGEAHARSPSQQVAERKREPGQRGVGGGRLPALSLSPARSSATSRHRPLGGHVCPLVAKPGASRSRLGRCLLPPGGLGGREPRPPECPAHSSLLRGAQGW